MSFKHVSRMELVDTICAKRRKLDQIESEEVDYAFEIKKLKYELNTLIGINQFPLEIIALIMDHLSAEDTIACEAVCQRWAYFIKRLNLTSLVVTKERERRPRKWSYSDELIQPESTVVKPRLEFDNLEDSFLFNLRRLKIINDTDEPDSVLICRLPMLNDLDLVNKLAYLQVLEICKIDLENGATITLPNLEYLAIDCVRSKLKLVTPKLTAYKGDLKNVQFAFPEQLKRLYLQHQCPEIKQFTSLEYLCVKRLNEDARLLVEHPTLKLLSIRPDSKYVDRFQAYDELQKNFDLLKMSALQILAQKKRLKRDGLRLVFHGIELENPNQLDDYESQNELVKLHIANYAKLCQSELRWIRRLNYSSLMRCVDEGVIEAAPEDFFERFDQVNDILVTEAFDEEQLFEFLKKFKNFNTFSLDYKYPHTSDFEQLESEFYEKLLVKFPIWHLRFEDSDLDSNAVYEPCPYLFKSDTIYKLYTEEDEDYEIVAEKIFDHFETFEYTFNINDSIATVKRSQKNGRFEVWCQNEFFRDFSNLGKAFEKLYESYGD